MARERTWPEREEGESKRNTEVERVDRKGSFRNRKYKKEMLKRVQEKREK